GGPARAVNGWASDGAGRWRSSDGGWPRSWGEPVRELDQRGEHVVRLGAVGCGLPLAVDPCRGDAERPGGRDVVEVALRGVDPPAGGGVGPRRGGEGGGGRGGGGPFRGERAAGKARERAPP